MTVVPPHLAAAIGALTGRVVCVECCATGADLAAEHGAYGWTVIVRHNSGCPVLADGVAAERATWDVLDALEAVGVVVGDYAAGPQAWHRRRRYEPA